MGKLYAHTDAYDSARDADADIDYRIADFAGGDADGYDGLANFAIETPEPAP